MQKMCGVVWCWTGDLDGADERSPRHAAQPGIALDGVQPMPFPILNSAFDELYPHGDQWYWRADFVEEIPDEAVARHVEFGEKLPTWKSTMHLYPINGAAHRVGRPRRPGLSATPTGAWSWRRRSRPGERGRARGVVPSATSMRSIRTPPAART